MLFSCIRQGFLLLILIYFILIKYSSKNGYIKYSFLQTGPLVLIIPQIHYDCIITNFPSRICNNL